MVRDGRVKQNECASFIWWDLWRKCLPVGMRSLSLNLWVWVVAYIVFMEWTEEWILGLFYLQNITNSFHFHVIWFLPSKRELSLFFLTLFDLLFYRLNADVLDILYKVYIWLHFIDKVITYLHLKRSIFEEDIQKGIAKM